MTASARFAQALSASEWMTADRHEVRYAVAQRAVDAIAARLDERLPVHCFGGAHCSRQPQHLHFTTTVYFDTPSRLQFLAATASRGPKIKLRVKQYYDVAQASGGAARAELTALQPGLWLELKKRESMRTTKQRMRLSKRELEAVLACASQLPDEVALRDARNLEAIQAYARSLAEPLRPDGVVNYRRMAWQDSEARVRVTLDVGVRFFVPPLKLWSEEQPLTPARLGPDVGSLRHAVLEIKYREPPPTWLERALTEFGAERSRSGKFELCSRAVHGDAAAPVVEST